MPVAPDDVPLTAEQQSLVLCVVPLARSLARCSPHPLIREYGIEGVEQEAYLAACRAAVKFVAEKVNADLTTADGWSSYAASGIRYHLMNLVRKSTLRYPVWNEWPCSDDGCPVAGPPAPPDCGTTLSAWCEEGARATRAHLPLRWRVILYLVAVEGWHSVEVAEVFGMSRQNLTRIRERAVESIVIGSRAKRRGKRSKVFSSLT